MAMNDVRHRHLVWALRDRLPLEQITPTHDISTELLPDPPLIDGYQPDLLAKSLAETLVIGVAKDGTELDSPTAIEEYRAFTAYKDPQSGELAALIVVVANEDKQKAEVALAKAGVSERSSVFSVGLPT
jgi:hypothetical protein